MSDAKDADVDRLTAIKELLDRCVRRPNEQYAYSRCEVCGTAFWDREEHRFGCKLLEWREALRDQSLSQEAVRDEVLEALEEGYAVLADVTNQWEGRHTIAGQKLLCKMRDAIASATGISGEFIQDNATNPLKREPTAAAKIGQSYEVMGIEQANDWALPTTAKIGASSAAPFPIYRVEDEVRASSCPNPQECKRANRCLNESPCGKFEAMTAPAAPDVASMVKRAEQNAQYWLKAGYEEPHRDLAVLNVEQAMNAYKNAMYALLAKLGQRWIPVGWIQEHKSGRKTFYEGDLNPREVHDNGCPVYQVFKVPGASDD